MRPIVERNLAALAAFAVAAVLVGVPVGGGLVCLVVFGVVTLVVAAVQRRRAVVRAGRARQQRGTSRSPAPRPPKVVVDDAESYGWPRMT